MAKSGKKSGYEERHREMLAGLPGCAGEYIRLVARRMGYRRKVRGEVMAELAGHFADALKGCASEGERDKKARELIEEFGDAKLLGVLCRRAKKRCRPLWRTVIARSFQAVGILLVCLIVYIVWFLTGKPVITIDYIAELNRMVRPEGDESLNAAPLYIEAAEAIEEPPRDAAFALRKRAKDANESDRRSMREWVDENASILEMVVAGSKKPYCWQRYSNPDNTTEMMGILMPQLSSYRRLAYTLCGRASLHAEAGDYKTAFDDLMACYRFGRHLKGRATLIEQLVGMAIEGLSVNALRDTLGAYGEAVDKAAIVKLQESLEEATDGETFTADFSSEKLFMYDEIQRGFTEGVDGGHLNIRRIHTLGDEVTVISAISAMEMPQGSGDSAEEGFFDELVDIVRDVSDGIVEFGQFARKAGYVLFLHPDKEETRKSVDSFYAAMEDYAGMTPAKRRAEAIDIDAKAEELAAGNILLKLMLPAAGKVIEISYKNKANVEATKAAVAVIRFEKDSGAFPDSLAELVEEGYLERGVPMDPYSDGPLVYRKAGDDFTLYSVGENFDDDGGMAGRDRDGRLKLWGSSGDAVFWPIDKGGSE